MYAGSEPLYVTPSEQCCAPARSPGAMLLTLHVVDAGLPMLTLPVDAEPEPPPLVCSTAYATPEASAAAPATTPASPSFRRLRARRPAPTEVVPRLTALIRTPLPRTVRNVSRTRCWAAHRWW